MIGLRDERRRRLDGHRGGLWLWLGQRASAVLVLVTILIHLVLTHYFALGELSFTNIEQRIGITAVLVNDVVLLLAVVFHGLNGVRMLLLDYWFGGAGARRVLGIVLLVIGAAAVVFGVWVLWVWVN